MNPLFAVARTTSEPLAAETVSGAFRGVPGLTAYDANTTGGDGHGIVGRGLSAEQAAVLQANLKSAGVATELVEESQLPALPPAKIIRRVEIKPEALFIEDLIKGLIPIGWERVLLIAAGSVQLTKVSRNLIEQEDFTQHIHVAHGIPAYQSTSNYVSKETVDWFLRAEILMTDGKLRYSIEAERFNFVPLGEGVTRDLAGNFCLLVRGLAAHAPKALLSRGAASMVSDPPEFIYYPRKGAFYDEITWMLWQTHLTEG